MRRDVQNQIDLERKGWRVLRFWESEILTDAERVCGEIILALEGLDEWA
jgi:very-short-patch-repair endonuclease